MSSDEVYVYIFHYLCTTFPVPAQLDETHHSVAMIDTHHHLPYPHTSHTVDMWSYLGNYQHRGLNHSHPSGHCSYLQMLDLRCAMMSSQGGLASSSVYSSRYNSSFSSHFMTFALLCSLSTLGLFLVDLKSLIIV